MTSNAQWFIYIVQCADGSLYTGITRDLSKRIAQHNAGKGSKYVRSRLPVELIYREPHTSHSSALKREWQIKQLTRQEKEALFAPEAKNATIKEH